MYVSLSYGGESVGLETFSRDRLQFCGDSDYTISDNIKIVYAVKSFNYIGIKFRSLRSMDVFVDILIHGFQIILYITKVNKYLVGILKSLNVRPTKYMELNVQRI